uniref:Putative secreted protein n=1 Tax=Lutzomyia longipalpis TaxID=7200 RepID=A0A7G3ANE4_LUTLO
MLVLIVLFIFANFFYLSSLLAHNLERNLLIDPLQKSHKSVLKRDFFLSQNCEHLRGFFKSFSSHFLRFGQLTKYFFFF